MLFCCKSACHPAQPFSAFFLREASALKFLTRDFFTGGLRRKISHVRFFHGRPSQKNFSREIFSWEASAEKFSHARFFYGRPPQKIFSREIFSREASAEKSRTLWLRCSLSLRAALPAPAARPFGTLLPLHRIIDNVLNVRC